MERIFVLEQFKFSNPMGKMGDNKIGFPLKYKDSKYCGNTVGIESIWLYSIHSALRFRGRGGRNVKLLDPANKYTSESGNCGSVSIPIDTQLK